MADNFDTPPSTPVEAPALPPLPDYGDVGPYFDPQGQPYVPLPGQSPSEFPAPQITPGAPPSAAPPTDIPGVPTPGVPPVLVSPGSTVGGFVGIGPFYAPGSGKLSERELRRLLGERVPGGLDSVLGGILGGRGIFRGTYRRPALATVARRALRVLVRRAVERFTPTNVPPKGGLPVPVGPRVPNPLRGMGVLGGLILAGRPTVLGRGDLGSQEAIDYYNLNPIRVPGRMIGTGPSPFPLGQPVNVSVSRVLGQLGGPTPALPGPPRPTPFGQRVLDAVLNGGDMQDVYDELGRQLGLPPMPARGYGDRTPPTVDAPRGAPIPATPTAPVPGVPTVQIGRPTAPASPRARRGPRIGIGAGAIVAGLVLERVGRGGSRRGPEPGLSFAPPITNTPESQNVTPVAPSPLTALNAGFVGFGGGEIGGCSCKPRGPRRKCLQRAPVRWSGGPRKGKSAGTRCIRFKGAR